MKKAILRATVYAMLCTLLCFLPTLLPAQFPFFESNRSASLKNLYGMSSEQITQYEVLLNGITAKQTEQSMKKRSAQEKKAQENTLSAQLKAGARSILSADQFSKWEQATDGDIHKRYFVEDLGLSLNKYASYTVAVDQYNTDMANMYSRTGLDSKKIKELSGKASDKLKGGFSGIASTQVFDFLVQEVLLAHLAAMISKDYQIISEYHARQCAAERIKFNDLLDSKRKQLGNSFTFAQQQALKNEYHNQLRNILPESELAAFLAREQWLMDEYIRMKFKMTSDQYQAYLKIDQKRSNEMSKVRSSKLPKETKQVALKELESEFENQLKAILPAEQYKLLIGRIDQRERRKPGK